MSPLARLFSQHRITVSRVFGFAFVAALLATGSVWQGTLIGRAMFLAGIVLAADRHGRPDLVPAPTPAATRVRNW